jgi:antirestriction protein ArdC
MKEIILSQLKFRIMDSQNTSSTKLDVYEIVTNRIIELLEAGTVPWQKPWTESGVPMNLMSKRPYRSINLWLLLSLNYDRNLFLTWDQLKKIGGSVNKDEHGHVVVFWKSIKKEEEKESKAVPMLRYYKVFNIAQCRDIPAHLIPELVNLASDPILEAEAVVNCMPDSPLLIFKGKQAYYDVSKDHVVLPQLKSFKTSEAYYSTLFHELVHSTGAEKRLGRKSITEMAEFGSEPYSIEELIAELGAAYLNSYTGILDKSIENSVAYLQGWLAKLKNDKRFIITASGQAQKAVDFILGRKDSEAKDEIDESVGESVVS